METNNFEYDDLVKNIRNIISAKGFKQGAIAKKANFTDSEFSNMLNDRRKLIRAEYLPQIAHALDVDVNELFRKWGGEIMEQFVNAKQLQRIINEANPDVLGGWADGDGIQTKAQAAEGVKKDTFHSYQPTKVSTSMALISHLHYSTKKPIPPSLDDSKAKGSWDGQKGVI